MEREREKGWRGLVKRCKNVIYRFRSACDERQCVPVGGWTRAQHCFQGYRGIGEGGEKKREKKEGEKNVSAVIRIIRFTASHLRSDSHDRGMKKRSWKVFRPCTDCFLVFSSPLFPSNSLEGKVNFQILFSLSLFLFLRSMFRARNFRNSSIALDEDWFRTLCKLFFFFCEKFEKFKKRFFESIFHP